MQDWWTSIVRFQAQEPLKAWRNSPECQTLLEEVKSLCSSLGVSQFDSLSSWGASKASEASNPPSWKLAMTIVTALFPAIFSIAHYIIPVIKGLFPLTCPLVVLINRVLAVSAVTWITMPIVKKFTGPWLSSDDTGTMIRGAFILAGFWILLALVFGQLPLANAGVLISSAWL